MSVKKFLDLNWGAKTSPKRRLEFQTKQTGEKNSKLRTSVDLSASWLHLDTMWSVTSTPAGKPAPPWWTVPLAVCPPHKKAFFFFTLFLSSKTPVIPSEKVVNTTGNCIFSCLNEKCSLGPSIWTLDPQVVMLFGDVDLGRAALLEEVCPQETNFKGLQPHLTSRYFSLPPL